jgi:pimeloyl-ACP methyl ester carboxylesterase
VGAGTKPFPTQLMSFPYLDEIKELDEAPRQQADGSFVALADGVTHYELAGPESGKPAVLVHGFSTPYFIFDNTFDFLVNSGFRVLRYDLMGRGYSDRPRVDYNIHLFVSQLKGLLDTLGLKHINLVGLSMGGAITASFVSEHPDYVSKYVLIDPAGAKQVSLPWFLEALKMPIIGELALGLLGSATMLKSIASDFFDPESVKHFQAQYKVQMQYKGFKRAILSTMRNNMLESFYETYAHVGRLQKPTLLFWGMKDTTVPFEYSKFIMKAIPHTEFHAIENCGHIPHYEKPGKVNPILLEFLSR